MIKVKSKDKSVKKSQLKFDTSLEGFKDYAEQFKVFSEREKEVRMFLYAVLMKEHVLLKGLPGTAKSMMAKMFLNNISNAKVFSQAFNAFMDDSYVFGPQLLEEFKKGNIVHNTKNSLIDCEFAFLDEFFEANEQVLTSCNEVLNERSFTRNAQQEDSPLITAIMTTNRDRESEKNLEAVYDRVLFKSKVLKVSSEENKLEMYKNAMAGKLNAIEPFGFDQLEKVYVAIKKSKIDFSIGILNCYSLFIKEYEDQSNVYISDRKAIKGMTLLKVSALVHGRKQVALEDFRELGYIFCTANEPKEETIFDSAFAKIKNEFDRIEKESRLIEECENTFQDLSGDLSKASGYKDYKALKEVGVSLKKKIKDTIQNVGAESVDTLQKMTDNLEEVLGVVADELKGFKKSGGDDAEKEDSDWFDDISKGGKNKKSKIDDVLEDDESGT